MDCPVLFALSGVWFAGGVVAWVLAERRAGAGDRKMKALENQLEGETARRVACEQERNDLRRRIGGGLTR